jgi:hypothetical protein
MFEVQEALELQKQEFNKKARSADQLLMSQALHLAGCCQADSADTAGFLR